MTPTARSDNAKPEGLRLKKIAEWVGGELLGDGSVTIRGVADIREAREGDITFLSNSKYHSFLDKTQASAVITPRSTAFSKKPLIRTSNPSIAFSKVVSHFASPRPVPKPGTHPTAVLGKKVRLADRVSIGPHAVLEDGVAIGAGSVIEANTFVGAGSRIGSKVHIYPNVTIREETRIGDRVIIHSGTVIGGDGFGYETTDEGMVKIPQIGNVEIEDDVEIGSNVCVDRGRFRPTKIGKGTKIDNLVQIAHNVEIGSNCVIVSQAGISGSTRLGKKVIVAAKAGLVGHIELGDRVIVGAGSGVTKSFPDGSVILGGPAKPIAEQKKLFAYIARLPELFRDLAEMRKKNKGGDPA